MFPGAVRSAGERPGGVKLERQGHLRLADARGKDGTGRIRHVTTDHQTYFDNKRQTRWSDP